MKVLETKTNEGVKKAKIIEKQFYQAKYDKVNMGNVHKRNKGKKNYMRTFIKLKFNTNRTVNEIIKLKMTVIITVITVIYIIDKFYRKNV